MTRAEKVIWIFFAATSIQLTFLCPYVILVRGERTNLFSGLLCFLTLAVAVILGGRRAIKLKAPEFLISAALVILGFISSFHSLPPLPAFYRVATLLASGLGGFWCARILLNTPENQGRFLWLALFLLAGVVLLSLAGFLLTGKIEYFLNNSHPHPLTNVIFLLSFAPLALLGRKSPRLKWLGLILLGLSYIVLCLSQRLSVIFIPVGLGLFGVLFGALRWKHLVAALLVIALIIGLSSHYILWFKLSKEYPHYRIENFFFSWTIIKQHPLLGIGLRTPRDRFLKDYQVKYPYNTKEQFAEDVATFVTADNQILTLMNSLGLPFTLIYCLAVLALMVKLIRLAWRPPPGQFFPPLALLFPLSLALVHWQLYDGLLFSQNSWFFHILLGLIPVTATAPEVQGAAASTGLSQNYPTSAFPEPADKETFRQVYAMMASRKAAAQRKDLKYPGFWGVNPGERAAASCRWARGLPARPWPQAMATLLIRPGGKFETGPGRPILTGLSPANCSLAASGAATAVTTEGMNRVW